MSLFTTGLLTTPARLLGYKCVQVLNSMLVNKKQKENVAIHSTTETSY